MSHACGRGHDGHGHSHSHAGHCHDLEHRQSHKSRSGKANRKAQTDQERMELEERQALGK